MAETFHISLQQAEAYEEEFVPAVFGQWAPRLVDAVNLSPGEHVLDVACGTGVAARTAAERVGPGGSVTGIDLNPAMLEVARRLRPDIEWREGDAVDLPFEAAEFDAVLCESALMFVHDPVAALREMARVVRPAGRVGVQVYASLEDQPGYGPFVELVVRHAGEEARSLLSTYWVAGDLEHLERQFQAAGLTVTQTRTELGTARFPSVDAVVQVEISDTPLADRIDSDLVERIRREAQRVLAPFRTPGGTVELPLRAHIVVASPR